MHLNSKAATALIGAVSLAVLVLTAACSSGDTGPSVVEAAEIPEPDVTYYVVAYHWGWGVFDEQGREVDAVRVPEGTTVEMYAVNDAAADAIALLPAPVAAAISAIGWDSERMQRDIAEGRLPDPALTVGMPVEEIMHDEEEEEADGHAEEEAEADAHDEEGDAAADAMPAWRMPWLGEERELATHGFLIPWYGVATKLQPDAEEPFRTVFIADRSGDFEFVCTVYCGYGHRYQPRTMLFVSAAQ